MRRCVFCKRPYKQGSKISFHKLPTNPTERNIWIQNMKAYNWILKDAKENDALCSEHFDPKCFEKHFNRTVLKFGSLPTIFERLSESSPGSSNSTGSGGSKFHSPKPSEVKTLLSDIFLKKYHDYQNDASTSEKKDDFKKDKQDEQQIKLIKLTSSQLAIPKTAKKINITSQPQKQRHTSLQEQVDYSTDIKTLNIKEEPSEREQHIEMNDVEGTTSLVVEKDFVKSKSWKGNQYVNGQSQPKRARLDIPEFPDEYVKQLYEFGKHVTEQLLCLNVEDARIAQKDIIAALSKFRHKRIREPRKSKAMEKSCMVEIEIEALKPAVTSEFSNVKSAGPPVSQMLEANIPRSSVSQKSQGHFLGSPVSQKSRAMLSNTRSRKVVGSILTEVAVTNVKPDFSSDISLNYSLTTSEPGLNIAPLEKTERVLASPESSASIGLIANQSSANVILAGSLVSQTGFSSIDYSEISVKTDPDSESTYNHVNVYGSDEMASSDIKR